MTDALEQLAALVANDPDRRAVLTVAELLINHIERNDDCAAFAVCLGHAGRCGTFRSYVEMSPARVSERVETWARACNLQHGDTIVVAQSMDAHGLASPSYISVRVEPFGLPVRSWVAPAVNRGVGAFEPATWPVPTVADKLDQIEARARVKRGGLLH